MNLQLPALYPILNISGADSDEIAAKIALAGELAGAGAPLMQLRAKQLAAGAFAELAATLVRLLAPKHCALIVNDRADIAAASGAAGVHLGDEDLPASAARRMLGPAAIIGVSTHSPDDVRALDADAVNYIGFGPVFDSPTKAGVRLARGTDMLRSVCALAPVPVVAIGGVESSRAADVFGAGAASCAVISEIEASPQPRGLVKEYEKLRGRAAEGA